MVCTVLRGFHAMYWWQLLLNYLASIMRPNANSLLSAHLSRKVLLQKMICSITSFPARLCCSFERKPAETIQKDLGTDYVSRANSALTTIRGVNKTDVKTLGDAFGSMAAIFQASAQELQACPGIGPTKARRLHET